MSPQGRRAGQEAARAAEQAARAARQIAERIASTAARTGAKAGGLPADAIVAMPVERELVLYRLVRQDPRIFEAFLSNLAKGKRPFPDEWFILRGGVSMFEHAEQALSIAKDRPWSPPSRSSQAADSMCQRRAVLGTTPSGAIPSIFMSGQPWCIMIRRYRADTRGCGHAMTNRTQA